MDADAPPARRPSRNALAEALTPISRAGGYYTRSWVRYLGGGAHSEVPVLRPTVGLAGQAFLDEVVLAGFRMLRSIGGEGTVARIEAEVDAAAEMYDAAGWSAEPARYHLTPPALEDVTVRTVTSPGQTYQRVSFESQYEPHADEPGRARWLGYAANRRARAWMLRHDEPRPWLVSVHGASMGRAGLDLRLLKARWLHERLGLNVIFPVLPLHGPRRRNVPKGATYPGEDVLANVHGAAQSVWDIRRIISWIRAGDPDARIGITGISLGGFTTALVASLEEGLVCAIAGVPAVDLVDLIEHHAGLAPDDERRRVVEVAKRVGRVISPLELTPLVPHEGRFVYAGVADRLVHPRRQVIRLWEHWGRPEIEWYPGGHTGFSRSKPVGRFVREALTRSGLVTDRETALTAR